eukprot:94438-Pyramimonas_sp.AAC.1
MPCGIDGAFSIIYVVFAFGAVMRHSKARSAQWSLWKTQGRLYRRWASRFSGASASLSEFGAASVPIARCP